MAIPVIMPKLEMTQETATVVEWLKQEGDHVEKGEPLSRRIGHAEVARGRIPRNFLKMVVNLDRRSGGHSRDHFGRPVRGRIINDVNIIRESVIHFLVDQ